MMPPEKSPINHPTPKVWEATNWVIALGENGLYRKQYLAVNDRNEALDRLEEGELPKAVFGWSGQHFAYSDIRSVEWVPTVQLVLVRRSWLRDPWRLPFADPATGKQFYETVAKQLPHRSEPTDSKVGPHDLPMEPRLMLGVFLTFMGLVAVVLGAIEGAGNAQGQAFGFLAELGETIGPKGAIAVGATGLLAGVVGLVWWYRRRPTKWVIAAKRK